MTSSMAVKIEKSEGLFYVGVLPSSIPSNPPPLASTSAPWIIALEKRERQEKW